MNEVVVRIGTVTEVEKSTSTMGDGEPFADALRVRVNLEGQDQANASPWAFPLLPKTFRTTPKEGEAVLVITANLGNTSSQRYYIGPIISQPQFFGNTPRDVAESVLQTSKGKTSRVVPLTAYSKQKGTKGAFPNDNDVAVIGRGQEDVVLKYSDGGGSELDLRARYKKGNKWRYFK